MESWERKKIEEQGSGKDFHLLKFPKDAEAINDFYSWAASARKGPGLENKGLGKLGMFWDERLFWMRRNFVAIKEAYAKMGRERFRIRTIEELGFDFEKWTREHQESFEE